MKFVSVFAFASLLFLTCILPVIADERIDIFADETFSVNVDNEGFAAHNIEFNFTIPNHTNCTITFVYDNKLEGIKYEDCYLKEVSIVIDGKYFLTRRFDVSVQGVKITEDVVFTPNKELYGGIVLYGSGEQRFYGTFSMYITHRTEGSGLVDFFNPLSFESSWPFYSVVTLASGVILIVAIRRRRHREDA